MNKGNNKITELRTILQKESQNSWLYKQTKSVNNRKTENRNDPDLVQAFLKKWWVESDFKAPNLPLSLRLNVIPEACRAHWIRYLHFYKPFVNYLIYKQWKQQTKLNPKKQGKDNTNNAKNTE
jgi:hypothetical protein